MMNKSKKKNNKKEKNSSCKRGLKIGCINVRGIVSNINKRVELNFWMNTHNIDVLCIQEWYVPRNAKENMNDSKINDFFDESDNSNDSNDLIEIKENIDFDMVEFPNYEKVSWDLKTMIMYKKGLEIIDLKYIGNIDYDGIDACWIINIRCLSWNIHVK